MEYQMVFGRCLGYRQKKWIGLEAETSKEVVIIVKVRGAGLDYDCAVEMEGCRRI